MEPFIDIIRYMTVGCLVLLLIQLLRSPGARQLVVPTVALAFCALSYLIVDGVTMPIPIGLYPFLIGAFTLPYVFWIFSRSLFDDHFELKAWMFWLLLLVIVLQSLFFLINSLRWLELSPNFIPVSWIAQHSLSLFFVVLGILEAVRNKAADLLTNRLKFRNSFILFTAGLMVLTLLSEIAFQGKEAPLTLELLQKIVIAGLTYYYAIRRTSFKSGFFVEKATNKEEPVYTAVDQDLLDTLTDLMDKQQIWKTEGLTIRELADLMAVKEYRLRQTINQHLNFRNFNDFLNSYRIAEASKLLADPAKKQFTVLEIAYEMGYSSLSPFNKAFKKDDRNDSYRLAKSSKRLNPPRFRNPSAFFRMDRTTCSPTCIFAPTLFHQKVIIMKKVILSINVLLSLSVLMAQTSLPINQQFNTGSSKAAFPGGHVALQTYLQKQLQYPEVARTYGIEGIVKLGVLIRKDGTIGDVWLIEGLCHVCDAEAMRLAWTMPPWLPAYEKEQPVESSVELGVSFRLQ